MRYEVLGTIGLLNDDRILRVNARKIGTLLVILLSNAGRVVSTDQIVSEIWRDQVPGRAVAGVYVYISQIRKMIAELGGPEDRVHTTPHGYLLQLVDDEVDAHSFLRYTAAGRVQLASGQYESAERTLEKALAQWRGPLAWGADCGPNAAAFATRLTETRMETTELLIDAQLHLGRHRELVGRLYPLVTEYPFREAFHRQLMLALYRSDRRADALRAYQTARRTMLDELGLEPCRSLQSLQREILAADVRVLNGYGV